MEDFKEWKLEDFRGVKKLDFSDRVISFEGDTQEELNLMEKEYFEKAYNKGHEEGVKEGHALVQRKFQDELEKLSFFLEEAQNLKVSLLEENKEQICHLIKALTKWTLFKELEKDEDYVPRALKEMIKHFEENKKLTLRINSSRFEKYPDLVSKIKEKISSLKEVEIEINPNLQGEGLIVESQGQIIDGSVEEQFKKIDQIIDGKI